MKGASRLLAYLLLAFACVLGCTSLGLFGWFLWAGPRPILNLDLDTSAAIAFDALLALAFFVQHSGMIRRPFRARLAAMLPDYCFSAIYAVASGVVLALLPLLWQPARPEIISFGGPLRWAVRGIFLATMAGMVWGFGSLKYFDPLGSRPIWAQLRGVPAPAVPLAIRGPYRWVRHPIYSLFLVMVWASPDVSVDRLLFNVLWSLWMVIATHLEERDLTAEFGEAYREYQRGVPMFVPHSLRPLA